MSHKKAEDRLEGLIARAVDLGPIQFDRRKWLDRLAQEPPGPPLTGSGVNHPRRNILGIVWRNIMGSRMTKYAVAALVTLAAVVVLNPLGTSSNGVALAAVQEKVAQVNTMVQRGEKVFSCVAEPNLVFRFDCLKYTSRQYGHVDEGRRSGTLVYRFTLNLPEKQLLLLLPTWHKCLKRPYTDEQIKILERVLTPAGIMDVMLGMDYRKLGPARINGTAVEGFAFQDIKPVQDLWPKYLLDIQEGAGSLWVDTRELLPVRIEGDLLIGKSAMTLFTDVRLHEVDNLESYNVELPDELFSTEVPAGYTELKLSDLVPGLSTLVSMGILPGSGTEQDAQEETRK